MFTKMFSKATQTRAAAMGLLLTLLLAGCVTQHSSHGSRVMLYDSVDALVADSTVVVVGTVRASEPTNDLRDVGPFTVSTLDVEDVVPVTGLREDARDQAALVAGEPIRVRQLGDSKQPGPVEFLRTGETYLLFLRPTSLDGDAASDYYVTGGTAGIFLERGGSNPPTFIHYDELFGPSGDNLPGEISLSDLKLE